MDSKTIKVFILVIIAMIGVLGILIYQLVITNNIIEKEEQRNESNKKNEEYKDTIVNIKETKTYSNLISKIDNNNIYIDMQINDDDNIIVVSKDNKMYVGTR